MCQAIGYHVFIREDRGISMLDEGFKINMLHGATERAEKQKKLEKNIGHATNAGKYVLGQYLKRPKQAIHNYLVTRDINKRNKKMAKRAAKNITREEIIEAILAEGLPPGAIDKALKRAGEITHAIGRNKIVKNIRVRGKLASRAIHRSGINPVKKWAKDNPIKAGVGMAAASVFGKAASDVGANYLAHKGRMKTDPNYAEMTHHNVEAQKLRKQGGMQHNTSPTTREVVQNGHTKGNHQQQNAHVAVMRSMAQDKVNTAGLAGKKFQRQDVRQKTNTRTADVHALDNIIENCANNVYTMETMQEGWADVAVAAKNAVVKHGKTALKFGKQVVKDVKGSRSYRQARVVAKRKIINPIKRKVQGAVNTYKAANAAAKTESVSDLMGERAQEIYEIAPLVMAGLGWAAKKAGTALAVGTAKKIGKKLITPRQQTADVEGEYYPLSERVAPKAASPYSLNRETDPKNFYHSERDQYQNAHQDTEMTREKINRKKKSTINVIERILEGKYSKDWKEAGAKVKTRELKPAVKHLTHKIYRKSVKKVEEGVGPGFSTSSARRAKRPTTMAGHALKGIRKFRKWMNTGSDEARTRKRAGVAIAAVGTHQLWKRRKSNLKYQTKRAQHHERQLRDAEANIDYVHAKRNAKRDYDDARMESIMEESHTEKVRRKLRKEKARQKAAAYLEKMRKEKEKEDKD